MKNPVLNWEIGGTVFTILVGSMLHFTFELSGRFLPVALFSAVNESTWEHLKLAFWPALLWAIAKFKFIRKSTNNFLTAKTTGIYLMPLTITILFYSYKAILGADVFILNILIFIVAVVIGQIVSYRLLTSSPKPQTWDKVALIALSFLLICFSLFSFFPPQLALFQDPVTSGYGITD